MALGDILQELFNSSEVNTSLISVLVFLLIFILIFVALGKIRVFQESKGINVIVSVVIGLLSVYYAWQKGLMDYMILPYKSLGLVLIIIVPFLVLFFLTHWSDMNGAVRKIIWVIYGAILGIVWYTRYYEIDNFGNKILIAGVVLVVLMIVFDKQVHDFALWKKRKRDFRGR